MSTEVIFVPSPLGLMLVHNKLVEPLYSMKAAAAESSQAKKPYSD